MTSDVLLFLGLTVLLVAPVFVGSLQIPNFLRSSPAERHPAYMEVLAWFRTGVGRNGADPATMIDTPAIVRVEFGEGRVLLFSPHPELTDGMEDWLRLAFDWTVERPVEPDPVPTSTDSR